MKHGTAFENKKIYSPVLLIEFKGHPINRFTPEVYKADGEVFDPHWICHCDNIHDAYVEGLKKLKEAMEADGTVYRIEKYTDTLTHFVESHKELGV